MQNKKGLILAIIGLLLVVGVIFIFKQNRPVGNTADNLILFMATAAPTVKRWTLIWKPIKSPKKLKLKNWKFLRTKTMPN